MKAKEIVLYTFIDYYRRAQVANLFLSVILLISGIISDVGSLPTNTIWHKTHCNIVNTNGLYTVLEYSDYKNEGYLFAVLNENGEPVGEKINIEQKHIKAPASSYYNLFEYPMLYFTDQDGIVYSADLEKGIILWHYKPENASKPYRHSFDICINGQDIVFVFNDSIYKINKGRLSPCVSN